MRSWRWHYTLRHFKVIPIARLFPLICIGYFGNNVYPFRAGEFIRSFVLKRKEDIPVSSSLATVIIGTGLMVFLSQAQKRNIQSKREYRRSVDGLKRLANQAHYENNHGVVSDDDA